ncbi:MAG: response regulator [Deltaproteobacteria bacterium]|nr:response regulator [Deltaproteobacteria bacterium]
MRALVVDDEPHMGELVNRALVSRGFTCDVTHDGEAALQQLQQETPDLIIMDRQMPGMDGLALLQKIRSNPFLAQIPVLMLTAVSDSHEKLLAYESGVDDYLTKPFELDELVAKCGALVRLARRNLERNPTSNLPGGDAIEAAIQKRLKDGQPVAVCHADLDNFKSYADSHGFERANEVIALTSRILAGIGTLEGDGSEFVGHLGGDDFVLVLPESRYRRICTRILEEFDQKRARFHTPDELKQGYYMARDRRGRQAQFPLLSLSIAAVSSARENFATASAAGEALIEKKKRAKRIRGSAFVE